MEVPAVTGTLDLYMAEINRFPILTAEEEFRLAVRLKKYNDMEAAEKLVVSNLRFVVKIAHEYRNYGVKLADLVQEGNIGLMHAVKKFDPYKGYRLISYAVWWIRAYIQNYIIKSWSLVKIGTTQAQRKLFFKLSQARKRLESLSEKSPEFAEIAETLGVRPEEIEEMDMRMSSRDLSLDASVSEDGDSTHMDYLTYEGEDQETALIRKEEMELVQQNIAGALAEAERKGELHHPEPRHGGQPPDPAGDRRPLSHHPGAGQADRKTGPPETGPRHSLSGKGNQTDRGLTA